MIPSQAFDRRQTVRICVILYLKSVQILRYFWFVFSYIWTEYRKIRTRNNSVFGHFSCSEAFIRNIERF